MKHKISSSKDKNTKLHLNIYLQMPNNKQIYLKAPIPCPAGTLNELLSKATLGINSQIAYFETIDSNWLIDYKLQSRAGQLKNDCKLRCVVKNKTSQDYWRLCQFSILKCVGVGGFSKVYLIRSKIDGNFYVAKYIQKQKIQDRIQLVLNEKNINQQLNFPFLVKMHQFIQIQQFYVMILDYCPGGELFHLQRRLIRFEEAEARRYFIQVLLALEYMHSKQIIYRDLKPQNIMLDIQGHIRITDFGLAKIIKQKRYSLCGSLEYMSPQVLTRKGHSFEVDYYCLGALLYQMVIGCPPFYQSASSQNQTKFRIINEQISFPDDIRLSQNLKNLLILLLQKNPKKRLGHFGGVKQIKCHAWVGYINRVDYQMKKAQMPHSVDLDCFNFDKKDITPSADRLLYDMHLRQKMQKTSKRLIQLDRSKNRQHLSPYRQGVHKIIKRYKSQINLQRKSLSQIKNRREQSLNFHIKRRISKGHTSILNNMQSIKCLYVSKSQKSPNIAKFFRFPTEGNQINKYNLKPKRVYVNINTEDKDNQKQKQKQFRKKKPRQQYIFVQIKRT